MEQSATNDRVSTATDLTAAGNATSPAVDPGQLDRLVEYAAEIEKRLEWVADKVPPGGGQHPRYFAFQHWREKLSGVARQATRPNPTSPPFDLNRALYDCFLHSDPALDGFLYTVLARAGTFGDLSVKLARRALNAFVTDPTTYACVRQEWLPAAFLQPLHNSLENRAYARGENNSASADWGSFWRNLGRRRESKSDRLRTGVRSVDEALGGLHGMCFLAGAAGTGKSTLALELARGVLSQHPDVGVLLVLSDLGMSKTVIYERLLCREAGVSYRTLLNPERTAEAGGVIEMAGQRLRNDVLGRLLVAEPGISPKTDREMRSYLAELSACLRAACKCERLLTVVDYFQALRLTSGGSDAVQSVDEDHARLSVLQSYQNTSRTARRPAGDPLLVIGQVRKGDGARTRLTLEDLLGSSQLAYAGDTVLLLEEGKPSAAPGRTNLTLRVAKARDGGHRGDISLVFDHDLARIGEALTSASPRGVQGGRGTAGGRSHVDPLAGGGEE
jgi:RecA/RadA recombinase